MNQIFFKRKKSILWKKIKNVIEKNSKCLNDINYWKIKNNNQ